jgi:hypothetical protein
VAFTEVSALTGASLLAYLRQPCPRRTDMTGCRSPDSPARCLADHRISRWLPDACPLANRPSVLLRARRPTELCVSVAIWHDP